MTASDESPASVDSLRLAEFFVPIRVEREAYTQPLSHLWNLLRRSGWIVLLVALAAGVSAYVAAFAITPVYRASVTVLPVRADGGGGPLSALAGQFGGLTSLAGISLGSSSDQQTRALALLKSRQIAEGFIESEALLPKLFPDQWDAEAGQWIGDTDAPTLEDAFIKFDKDVRTVHEDKQTGVVTVSIDWPEPNEAASLANALVGAVNRHMRQEAVEEAQRSIRYLSAELAKTELVDIRSAAYGLIEAQLQTIMVANSRDEFPLRVIDPARSPDPDRYVWPRNVWLAAFGGFLGFGLALFVLWLRDPRPSSKSTDG